MPATSAGMTWCDKKRLLQRLDLHLAELDHAGAVLQRDGAFRVVGVVGAVDRLGAVERDVEARSLGGDLVDVPLAAGLQRGRRLGGVDNRAGAVARVGTLVEDVRLVGVN